MLRVSCFYNFLLFLTPAPPSHPMFFWNLKVQKNLWKGQTTRKSSQIVEAARCLSFSKAGSMYDVRTWKSLDVCGLERETSKEPNKCWLVTRFKAWHDFAAGLAEDISSHPISVSVIMSKFNFMVFIWWTVSGVLRIYLLFSPHSTSL